MKGSLVSRAVLTICMLIIGAVVGIGMAYSLLTPTTPEVLKPSDPLRSIPITMQSFDDPRAVELTAELLPPASVSVSRSGVITAWTCSKGATLTSGSSSIAVDGTSLLSLSTGVPLWRDLAPGAEGADVKAVEEELLRLGQSAHADAFLSWTEMRTIRTLADVAGVHLDTQLARDLVVWLPTPTATVDSCEKELGASISAGDAIAHVDSGIVLSSVALPAGRLPGPRVLDVLQEPIALGDAGELPTGVSPSRIRDSNAFREAVSGAPDASVLTLKGMVRLQEPVQVAAVPATAVVVDARGVSCVLSHDEPIPVTVVGSEFGSTFIAFEAPEPPPSIDAVKPGRKTSCR